jgi:hypothetical protein
LRGAIWLNGDMKVTDIEKIRFSSIVFPSAEDLALWENLSNEERAAIIARDEHAAFESGIAEKSTLREILAETRAEAKREL